MYNICSGGTETESVVQRHIERPPYVHVDCPQRESCQLVVHDGRVFQYSRHHQILVEKGPALCCVLCDGRSEVVLEEDIFHGLISSVLETFHGKRARRRRSCVQKADPGLRIDGTF
jgi:hypothetical protein